MFGAWGRAKNEMSNRGWNLHGIIRRLRFKITLSGNSTSYTGRVQNERYDLKKTNFKNYTQWKQCTCFQKRSTINIIYICMIITVFVSRTGIRRFGTTTECISHSDDKYACTLSRSSRQIFNVVKIKKIFKYRDDVPLFGNSITRL